MLSCLSGLLPPDAGRVTLDGSALGSLDSKSLARRRAYLPQSPRAEWPVSVERLVALGLTPQLPAFGGLPVDMAARVTETMRPGVVSISHGWAEANVNLLISSRDLDPLTGMPRSSGTAVSLHRVEP